MQAVPFQAQKPPLNVALQNGWEKSKQFVFTDGMHAVPVQAQLSLVLAELQSNDCENNAHATEGTHIPPFQEQPPSVFAVLQNAWENIEHTQL